MVFITDGIFIVRLNGIYAFKLFSPFATDHTLFCDLIEILNSVVRKNIP